MSVRPQFLQQRGNCGPQGGEGTFGYHLDPIMVDRGVAMDQYIPEGNNLADVWDASGQFGVQFPNLVQCLAYDLKLSFHRRVDHVGLRIKIGVQPRDEVQDRLCGLLHVPQILSGITLHR